MSKTIVITSGKGGVGKTTTSASIATGLAQRGYKTVVIDFDVGLRNLDLIMGCERRVVYDLVNLVNQEASLHQTLIKDKRVENLYILPASQTRDKDALSIEGVARVIHKLKKAEFDFIVCDSPAGIEKGAKMALYFADEAIITTNPEVSSVRDSDRILGILQSESKRAKMNEDPVREHLLITPLQPVACPGRADAQCRRHRRAAGHPAAGHHSRVAIGTRFLERRQAGGAGRRERGGPGLFRRDRSSAG